MSECPYYQVHVHTMRSNQIRADRQAQVERVQIPWCAHDESPVDQRTATRVIGGANLLRCAGELARCQVPGAAPTSPS